MTRGKVSCACASLFCHMTAKITSISESTCAFILMVMPVLIRAVCFLLLVSAMMKNSFEILRMCKSTLNHLFETLFVKRIHESGPQD